MFDLANNSDSVDPDYNNFQHNPIDFRYFSVDTFKEFSSSISESISLFHHNARSICTRPFQICNIVLDHFHHPLKSCG